MKKTIFEIRQKMVRGGVELQGIAKSDRGTKFIEDSIVVLTPPGEKRPTKEQLQAAIAELIGEAT